MQKIKALEKIKLIITDVDGVLTDGGLYYGEDGECFKKFNANDGLGATLARAMGLEIAVISGRSSKFLIKRINDLNIKYYDLGQLEKYQACIDIMQKAGVSSEETVFIGDDSIDLPAFKICGFNFAVNSAAQYIKDKADYCLSKNGGYGAFREVVDLILTAQGKESAFNSAEGFAQAIASLKGKASQ